MTTFSPKVELLINGTWTDVSSDVRWADGIQTRRGQQNEAGTSAPGQLLFTLENTTDKYNPRNPTGTYYGKIGRNTPVKVSMAHATRRAILPPWYVTAPTIDTPDSAGLSIVGDLDIRADVWLADWRHTSYIIRKWTTSGNQRSYLLELSQTGQLIFWWSNNGTAELSSTSTVAVPKRARGRLAVRATMDVNNGAAGNTVTFYTSDTISGTWTQLGSPVITAGTTSIFDSTAQLTISTSFQDRMMQVFACKVLSGIAGTEKANPDFTIQSENATSFADAAGNTWTMGGGSKLQARNYRFFGEIAAWNCKETDDGNDRWVEIEAAGVMRRLGQGAAPAFSSMRSVYSSLISSVAAYWPMEDGNNSTSYASGVDGGSPASYASLTGHSPNFANSSAFPGSAPLPTMGDTRLHGQVGSYSSTGVNNVSFLWKIPDAGVTVDTTLCYFFTTGTAKRWALIADPTGNLYLRAYDSSNTQILDTGGVAFNINGTSSWVQISLTQNGSNIDYEWDTRTLEQAGYAFWSGTLNSYTVGAITDVYLGDLSDLGDLVFGHLAVLNTRLDLFNYNQQFHAYIDELADDRFDRLANVQESLDTEFVGYQSDTTAMGYMGLKTLLEYLRECEASEVGILYEPRISAGRAGFAFHTRDGLYNQDAALTLSYTGYNLSALVSNEDDQTTKNDVTVVRDGGSSYRAIDSTSVMGTAAPPSGVGIYDDSVTLSLADDDQTPNQAGWRLNLGTFADPRWPSISFDLARSPFQSSAALLLAASEIDLGDRVVVTGVPTRRLNRDISGLVYGIIENFDQFQWRIELITKPEQPWHVLEYNTTTRWSPDGSTLAGTMTTTATSVSVASANDCWTTTDVPFDVEIAGERMTVTAVSGTTSPQTFTVTRSVNGVVKTQASGAAVELWDPVRWAL